MFVTCKPGKKLGHSTCIGSAEPMKEKYKPLNLLCWYHSVGFFIITSRRNLVQQELSNYFINYEIC